LALAGKLLLPDIPGQFLAEEGVLKGSTWRNLGAETDEGLLAPRLGSALAVAQTCLFCGFETILLGPWLVYIVFVRFNVMSYESTSSLLIVTFLCM
jgi:hypothetical protein